jgi:hypothetical protein
MAQRRGLRDKDMEENKQVEVKEEVMKEEPVEIKTLSWEDISQAAKSWLFGVSRVRAEPPLDEYTGLTVPEAKKVLNVMFETNVLFAKARAWLGSMKVIRRHLPTRDCVWADMEFEAACDTPLGMVQALNDFQVGLVTSGFSFHNILVRKSSIMQLTDSGMHKEIGAILGIVQRQLMREWRIWQQGTRSAKRGGQRTGDGVYDYLFVEATSELEDDLVRQVLDPWAELQLPTENYGPQVILVSNAPSIPVEAFTNSSLQHPTADQFPNQSSFPGSPRANQRTVQTPPTSGSMRESLISSRRMSGEMAFMAQACVSEDGEEKGGGVNDKLLPSTTRHGASTRNTQPFPSGARARMGRRTYGTGSAEEASDFEDTGGGNAQSSTVIPMLSPAIFGMQQLTKFDGKGSPKENREWFDQFEFLAGSCGWTSKQKLSTLKHYCKGAAREWWTYQAREGTVHWSQLRPAFMHSFCTDSRSKTQLYITAQQKSDETSLEFYRRLTNLAKRAGVKLNYKDPWEEHVDLFLSGLRSRDIRNQLRVLQFTDSAEIEATLERTERTARGFRSSRYDEEGELKSNNRPSLPVGRVKPKVKPSSPTKKAQAYLAQLDLESESEEEEEYAAYTIEDENGDEQVYMARIKDVATAETRPFRDDKPREKCSTCGKTGHGPAKCWLKMKCTECGGVGHPAEVCYRRCGFCDKAHEKKGPCPLKASVAELVQWARVTAEASDKNLPALPEQLLNW